MGKISFRKKLQRHVVHFVCNISLWKRAAPAPLFVRRFPRIIFDVLFKEVGAARLGQSYLAKRFKYGSHFAGMGTFEKVLHSVKPSMVVIALICRA